jgi:hypothetical protein
MILNLNDLKKKYTGLNLIKCLTCFGLVSALPDDFEVIQTLVYIKPGV